MAKVYEEQLAKKKTEHEKLINDLLERAEENKNQKNKLKKFQDEAKVVLIFPSFFLSFFISMYRRDKLPNTGQSWKAPPGSEILSKNSRRR